MLIGAEGTKTPRKCYRISFVRWLFEDAKFNVLREKRVRGDPTGAKRRGGSPTARGKRSAWSGYQQANLTELFL